jgi:hypothetical protein
MRDETADVAISLLAFMWHLTELRAAWKKIERGAQHY